MKHSVSPVRSLIAYYEALKVKHIHSCTQYVAAVIRNYLWQLVAMYFKTYLHVLNFRFHRGSVYGVYPGVTKIIMPRSQA